MSISNNTDSNIDNISQSVPAIPDSFTFTAADMESAPPISTVDDINQPIDNNTNIGNEILRPTSPRREHGDIERIGKEKAQVLQAEAASIQDSLAGIVDRIARIKDEYERLSSENKFLQDYIGNLMSTGNLISK